MGSEYFFCPTVLIQLALAITRDGFDKLAEYSFGFAGFNLTCACVHVMDMATMPVDINIAEKQEHAATFFRTRHVEAV